MKLKVPFYWQNTEYTCGPAALSMIFHFFGLFDNEKRIAREARSTEKGTTHLHMLTVATDRGFHCYSNDYSSVNEIRYFLSVGLPVIVHYIEPDGDEGHYSVVVGLTKQFIRLNDPWNGRDFRLTIRDFERRWHTGSRKRVRWVMVLSPHRFRVGNYYHPAPIKQHKKERVRIK